MALHHDEVQDLETAKYIWRKGGKWVVVAMVLAAIGYLGNVMWQNHLQGNNEAAAAEASQVKGDAAKLVALQQKYPDAATTAQASLDNAKLLFNSGKLDEAAAAYRWVLQQNKEPVFQAAATQNLANILMQQKKYDEALAVLNTPLDTSFAPVINEIKGDILAAQGKNAEAKSAYQAAWDKLPEQSASRELLELKMGQL